MKKTSNPNVVSAADTRQPAAHQHAANRRQRLRFGRLVGRQRVELAPLTMRALNALTRLVNLGIKAHQASGEPVSRSMQDALAALRAPRAGVLLDLVGVRAADVGGLVVRLDPKTGNVFLQALEPAGTLRRPNTARFWILRKDEVAGVARALCKIAGLTPEVPPNCMVAHRGIDCRSGEVVDQRAYDRQLEADTASVLEEADAIRREIFAPRPVTPTVVEGSPDA